MDTDGHRLELGRGSVARVVFGVLLIFSLFPLAHAVEKGVRLKDIDGHWQEPLAVEGRKASVWIFTTVDCPVANGYAPEIKRICDGFLKEGVALFLVHVDPDVDKATARKHAKEFGYTCPVLLDAKHALVKAAGAKVTPEAAVFDGAGKLVYRGRIDDRHEDYGVKRPEPTQRDLRVVLEALAKGERVEPRFTKSVGCFIPPLAKSAR